MERLVDLDLQTKDYFIESHEFLFTKKYTNVKTKNINLVYSAYNLEYNLILKDYKIFFENKLKTKFYQNTSLVRTYGKKHYTLSKYALIARNLKDFNIIDRNFDYQDIRIRPNAVMKFKIKNKKKDLYLQKLRSKFLTRKFFYNQLVELGRLKFYRHPQL